MAAGWALGMAMWGAGALPARVAIGIQLPPADDRFEIEHRQAVAANPPDLHLQLQVQGGSRRFHQGEIIRLDLGFSSTSPQRYRLDAAGYDRSGRLHLEEFHLAPAAGVVDPLWEYFTEYMARWGGGERQAPLLTEAPVTLTLDLNEWARFDRPGTYRLYVTSHRVAGLGSSPPVGFLAGVPAPVSSNVVELTIEDADAQWSGQVLADAIRAIDAGSPGDARTACRTLRFLGSPAAAREMARRYENDRPCSGELMLGLVGSPERQAVIRAMSARLVAPGQEVDSWFLENLALLAADPAGIPLHSPEALGRPPGFGRSEEEWRSRHATIEASWRRQAARLLEALPRKTGRARAVSALTLLDLATTPPSCGPREPSTVAPEQAEDLRQMVAEGFSELTADEQHGLLSVHWPMLRGLDMAAPLRHLYMDPYTDPPVLGWQGGENLRTLTLRRLYDLAPAEAVTLLLAEARRPVPRVGREALRLLPEQAASELELEIVEHLEEAPAGETDALSFLAAKFATRAMLPRVRAIYDSGMKDGMCPLVPLIAYFLRVEPVLGKAKLLQVLDTASPPGHRSCAAGVLSEVGKLFYSAELESVAISHLDDPDLEVATEAATLLGQRGSPAAEAPLWDRLEQWHAKWKTRGLPVDLFKSHEERSLAYALIDAIARSPAWLVERPQIERLRELSVGSQIADWVRSLMRVRDSAGRITLGIRYDGEEHPEFTVAQYTLPTLDAVRSKLAQFPRGTAFRWRSCPLPTQEQEQEAMVKELTGFVQSRGMALVR